MKDKSWELQEATWGIQDNYGWDDAPSRGEKAAASPPPPQITSQVQNDIYSAAERIDSNNPYQREMYQPQQPVLQPQNQSILNDLTGGDTADPVKPKIDTSFLDDLL